MMDNRWNIYLSICLFSTTGLLFHLVPLTTSEFSESFVWSAINRSLEEDRLSIVDATNEKVKIKGCARVVLYNHGSEKYGVSNYSGGGVIRINATHENFSTPEVLLDVKNKINETNPGRCVPCIVVISIMNVTSTKEERDYREIGNVTDKERIKGLEEQFQDYKLRLSHQLVELLQYKTPIQARHLILVRLVEKRDELTKCHGKKYTRYPKRLVSIWEQVLFDHFREARVIQGALESGQEEHKDGYHHHENKMLMTGKESGIWVWMCEEIIMRQEMHEKCEKEKGESEKETCFAEIANMTTAQVNMEDRGLCRMYRART